MKARVLLALIGALATLATSDDTPDKRRGLVSVSNKDFPEDDAIWVRKGSPISWYHNFHWDVTAAYANIPQDQLEFVPTMWGGGVNDTEFLDNLTEMIRPEGGGEGRAISHVMAFNMPDLPFEYGGSNMTPADAARSWVRNLLPLRQEFKIKLGLPLVGDPRGGWIDPFLRNCSELNKGKDCEFDFVPLHAFGHFGMLKDQIGKFSSAFPGKPLWVVQFGYPEQNLTATQEYYNQSIAYLEKHEAVARYSWFGAFRSTVSNVGPNMAMLDPWGNLTDIGSWYLGGEATGTPAMPNDVPSTDLCTVDHPCGATNSAVTAAGGPWLSLWSGVAALGLMMVL